MATATASPARPRFLDLDGGRLVVRPHQGQSRALRSDKRFVVVLAGTQGGKTVIGPYWLFREMQQRGPGDYLVVGPTYRLMQRKVVPEFERLFKQLLGLGELNKSEWIFRLTSEGERSVFGEDHGGETKIFFGYGDNPDSLESATAKAAWLDEAGQKSFRQGSWEAVQRRLAIHQGRALVTTTLYNLGWVVSEFWEPAKDAGWEHDDIEVVRFESRDNPVFPDDEWNRMRREWPAWKFNLQCRAIPTRPAGLIYDAFDREDHRIPRFTIPNGWPRHLGVDFGGVNTAAVWYAEDPDWEPGEGFRFYLYDTYKAGGRTAEQHAEKVREANHAHRDHPMPQTAVGGSPSEGQWRREFRAGGLPLREPDQGEVEVGIDRVYGFHARDELAVFDDLDAYIHEKETYSRKLDESGEPTEKIEDKSSFHMMDAERYVLGYLAPSAGRERVTDIVRWG